MEADGMQKRLLAYVVATVRQLVSYCEYLLFFATSYIYIYIYINVLITHPRMHIYYVYEANEDQNKSEDQSKIEASRRSQHAKEEEKQ